MALYDLLDSILSNTIQPNYGCEAKKMAKLQRDISHRNEAKWHK